MPKLQLTLQDGTELTHELTEDSVSVGRLPESTIELSDASVSSRHAELTVNGLDYRLKDIGSTNGTRINGKPLVAGESHSLQDGDSVSFGSVKGVYASENPADASPMPSAESAVAVAAESSIRPADFENASPFQTKSNKREPMAVAILSLGTVAIVGFLGALALVFLMKAPL